MLTLTDQRGNPVVLPKVPRRIVSLVPSQTELLSDLELDEQVVGITKFCVHPPHWLQRKARVGGTKNVAVEKVLALQPDLVLANKEENVKEQVAAIAAAVPTYVSDVADLGTALGMINDVGRMTGTSTAADKLAFGIAEEFRKAAPKALFPATVYLIWQEPFMTVGGDTFIHQMLHHAGFRNLFEREERYPATTIEALTALRPDVLLLSTEPFPFRQKHINSLLPLLPHTKILLADGEMFSWYGSRMLQAPAYFKSLRRLATGA